MVDGKFKTLRVKYCRKSPATHELFTKRHRAREESNDRPSELTLFVGNVPPYFNEEALQRLFQPCGPVKSVFFADVSSPSEIVAVSKDYKIAYVVFYNAKDLEKAVSWRPEKPLILTDDEFTIVTGLREYCQEYNNSLVPAEQIQRKIDECMKKYNVEKEKEEAKSNEPDEEGWTTVLKKGRNPGFARKQSVKDNIMKKIRNKRKRKELKNFYKHQIRESKMNHLSELQKKLELDKKKIEALKQRRMFKPF